MARMSDTSKWRGLTPEEVAVITAVILGSGDPGSRALVDGLDGAAASNRTDWIVDTKTIQESRDCDGQDDVTVCDVQTRSMSDPYCLVSRCARGRIRCLI